MRSRASFIDSRGRHSLGQALVETAILLPVLLILLLGAIDFGRAFFGWVNLHQAVRIGANYAATHPNMDVTERDRYEALVEGDLVALNCAIDSAIPNPTYTTRDGTPIANPGLGDYASLTLECDFSPITPLGSVFFGDPIPMTATSTFPIRDGCINCPTPVPATPPPAPLQCRIVPDMVGMSVAGARLAWEAAGFNPGNFTLISGAETATVSTAPVTQPEPPPTCNYPSEAIFTSTVLVSTSTPEAVSAGCATVPNLIGITVADAETAWIDAGFTGAFTVDDGGLPEDVVDPLRVVAQQDTTPESAEGVDCLDLTASIDVDTDDPWPDAPPAPCQVPNVISLSRRAGQTFWTDRGFAAANYSPSNGNFTIQSQTLVGGTWVPCGSIIRVSASAGP